MMRLKGNEICLLLSYVIVFFIFIDNKSYAKENAMTSDKGYLITTTPLIIHDYHGAKYSVLPAGVSLYPVTSDINSSNEYVIYINYQPLPGELVSFSNISDDNIISELYLSKPPVAFNKHYNKKLTRDSLVSILQNGTLTKKDFADLISEF